MDKHSSDSRLVVVAYIWNFLSNVVVRSFGLISTLILVRLLDSEDFGVVAIGMMVVGFFDVLANIGVNRYLILKEDPTFDDYSTAWTFNICLRTILFVILFVSSSRIASYFNNPELTFVFIVIGSVQLITSLNNIGLVKLEKELDFSIKNKIMMLAKCFSFAVTVSAAFYYHSYNAMLFGLIANALVFLVLSYKLCTFRPTFKLSFDKSMLAFSSFLFFRNFIGYVRAQADLFIISSAYGKTTTGDYSVARNFSMLPQGELIAPAMAPVFSALSKLKKAKEELEVKSFQALFLMYIIVVPSALGTYIIADAFTLVILGNKWIAISDVLGLLAFLMFPFTTQPILNILYDANNSVRQSILIDLLGIIILLFCFFMVLPKNLLEFVEVRIQVAAFMFAFSIAHAKWVINFSISKMLVVVSIPLVPSIMMFCVLRGLKGFGDEPLIELVVLVGTGVLIYGTILFILGLLQVNVLRLGFVNRLIPERVYNLLLILRKA